MIGPLIDFSRLEMYVASLVMPRSGFAGAITGKPSFVRRSITPFQLEPSANPPCTSTTVGLTWRVDRAATAAGAEPGAADAVPLADTAIAAAGPAVATAGISILRRLPPGGLMTFMGYSPLPLIEPPTRPPDAPAPG